MSDSSHWPILILMILLVIFAAAGALLLSAIHKHLTTDCKPLPSDTLPMARDDEGDDSDMSPRERQIRDQLVSWSRPMELH